MNVAILIAVEAYANKGIPSVSYAKSDATEFGETIQDQGFAKADQVLLVDGKATKSSIESRVKKTIQSLLEDDTLFLYYKGHGFSKDSSNYLTCHDTQLSDLVATSIPWHSLFQQIRASECRKVALFLDSCDSGLLETAEMRGIYRGLTEDEWKEFFEESEHRVCFAASKMGQKSWPSKQEKHGAWTHNLLEAFRGNAPMALTKGVLLTSTSLQNYLKDAVPRTLRRAYSNKKNQTPWMYGVSSADFLLGNLTEMFASRKTAANPDADQVLNVSFVSLKHQWVRSLSGFRKTHQVPDEVNDYTQAFIARIAMDDIDRDMKAIHGALRHEFQFKRVDIDVSQPKDGTGTIITPYFNYSVSVSLNPDDASEVVWHRQVSEIKEPDQILTEKFSGVFGDMFNSVEFSPAAKVDLETLIDRIQELDDERIKLDYDMDLTFCKLEITGVGGEIEVTPGTLSIVQPGPIPPKQLLESFFQMQTVLIEQCDVGSIAFDSHNS